MRFARFVLLAFVPIGFVLAAPAPEDGKKGDEKRDVFVAAALKRLGAEFPKGWTNDYIKSTKQLSSIRITGGKKNSPEDIKRAELALKKYAATSKSDAFVDLAKNLYNMAKGSETKSQVSIKTSRNGADKPGASVRYQLWWDREKELAPQTAKDTTKCNEEMTIGWYYIWSEREGHATSDRDKYYYIVKEKEEITLVEKR